MLKPIPDLTYQPHLLDEEEADLLQICRVYYDDPQQLFIILDALMEYYFRDDYARH